MLRKDSQSLAFNAFRGASSCLFRELLIDGLEYEAGVGLQGELELRHLGGELILDADDELEGLAFVEPARRLMQGVRGGMAICSTSGSTGRRASGEDRWDSGSMSYLLKPVPAAGKGCQGRPEDVIGGGASELRSY